MQALLTVEHALSRVKHRPARRVTAAAPHRGTADTLAPQAIPANPTAAGPRTGTNRSDPPAAGYRHAGPPHPPATPHPPPNPPPPPAPKPHSTFPPPPRQRPRPHPHCLADQRDRR